MKKTKRFIFPVILFGYVCVMFIVSSVYHSTIMDPLQFLWAFLFLLAGPVMFVIAAVIVGRKIAGKSISALTLVSAFFCLTIIPIWTFGFWTIGSACRPLMFSMVEDGNTAVAEIQMKQNPEGENFIIERFNYPFLNLGNAPARHQDGILLITVPSGPGPKDMIIYDPQNNTDHSKHQKLAGNWWYSPYKEN